MLRIILVFCIIAIISCSEQIEKDIPEPEKALIVNSLLTNDTIFIVKVGKLQSILDTSVINIDNANVSIFSGNSLISVLDYKGDGIYSLESQKPFINTPYSILVKYSDFPDAFSSDTIPSKVHIKRAYYNYVGEDPNGWESTFDTFVIIDDPEQINFYEIVFYIKVAFMETPNPDTTYFEYSTIMPEKVETNDVSILSEGMQNYQPHECFIFSDRLFNGKEKEIKLRIFSGSYFFPSFSNHVYSKIMVELRSVSYAYYQYRKEWSKHAYNQGIGSFSNFNEFSNFAIERNPYGMYSNIKGGYGIVAAYSKDTLSMTEIK